MRVRIHRGTKEIGGSCIELEADGYRVYQTSVCPSTATRTTLVVTLTSKASMGSAHLRRWCYPMGTSIIGASRHWPGPSFQLP